VGETRQGIWDVRYGSLADIRERTLNSKPSTQSTCGSSWMRMTYQPSYWEKPYYPVPESAGLAAAATSRPGLFLWNLPTGLGLIGARQSTNPPAPPPKPCRAKYRITPEKPGQSPGFLWWLKTKVGILRAVCQPIRITKFNSLQRSTVSAAAGSRPDGPVRY
jgi:hypothetical protein